MKQHLDKIMHERGIDALFVTGSASHNPSMYYFTGPAHMTGDLIKVRDCTPVLYYNPMERDEAARAAARSGMQTKNLADYNFRELLNQVDGDYLRASILRYKKMFEEQELTSGRVVMYGKVDIGSIVALVNGLQAALPEITYTGEMNDSLLLEAMSTKDDDEVERIRRMGELTTWVVGQTADFLTSHAVRDEVLVKGDGSPLRIGDVKKRINLWLMERGAENPEGTIFSIGRDAGVPHSIGNEEDLLRLGQTIVYDIYPCEAGGGYFYDFTRTWCLGYAPEPVEALYQDVYEVYQKVMGELKVNAPCSNYQMLTCDLFEAKGHPTIQTNPSIQEGYVHSLGHGLGLRVHEKPAFSQLATEKDRLYPGTVITVEPGLYYPERGMGVRLEDTIYVRQDGKIEVLAEFPLDLVLPLKG